MSALALRRFLSSPHRSFIDSTGSATIPSSLIQKLRAAILIALRTVEVFNGLFFRCRIRACQSSETFFFSKTLYIKSCWNIKDSICKTLSTDDQRSFDFETPLNKSWGPQRTNSNRQLWCLTTSSSIITSSAAEHWISSKVLEESHNNWVQPVSLYSPGYESPSMCLSGTDSLRFPFPVNTETLGDSGCWRPSHVDYSDFPSRSSSSWETTPAGRQHTQGACVDIQLSSTIAEGDMGKTILKWLRPLLRDCQWVMSS